MVGGRRFVFRFGRFAAICVFSIAAKAHADVVTFLHVTGQTLTVEGNVLAEDRDGTILLEGRDSQHFVVRRQDRTRWDRGAERLPPWNAAQLRDRLAKEFGPAYKTRSTVNYVLCSSASSEFTIEAGKLFERALNVFITYFKTKGGFTVAKPSQPMVAIICSSRDEYLRITAPIFGEIAAQSDGLYSPQTNRLYLFNAFGGPTEGRLRALAQQNRKDAEHASLLLKERNISVVIHEGIHQIAYNTGFHSRTSVQPIWLVEGMAMFFESPDLDRRGGWAGVGTVNRERLEHYQKLSSSRSIIPLGAIVVDDVALRGRNAVDGYAQAWALTHFLNKAKTQQYMRYLKIVNDRPPLENYSAEDRLRDFRTAFGKSPDELDVDMRRFLARLSVPERRK